MPTHILQHLNISYEIIKYIHSLYLKYTNFIRINSFESCGKGVDTIFNIIQNKVDNPIMIIIKIHKIKEYDNSKINTIYDLLDFILFLPISIITPIGIWNFVDNPEYIINDINFSLDLIKYFDPILIKPGYIDNSGNLFNPVFLLTKYNINIDKLDNFKKIDIRHLFKIYDYSELNKFNIDFSIYFNQFIIGYKLCNHLFTKFIKNMLYLCNFDDRKNYLKLYRFYKNKNLFHNNIINYFNNYGIYYNKPVENCIFYYTYLNYFNKFYDFFE